jgi:hypothetical protein
MAFTLLGMASSSIVITGSGLVLFATIGAAIWETRE